VVGDEHRRGCRGRRVDRAGRGLPARSGSVVAAARSPAGRGTQGRPGLPGAAARVVGRGAPAAGRGGRAGGAPAAGERGGGCGVIGDRREAMERLAAGDGGYVIGVRHHSPVLSAAIAALLDAAAPDRLLVELPDEMQPWLEWLAHPDTAAPVALAAAYERDDEPLAFYPFAAFSPALAALRAGRAARGPAECCDLPLADRAWTDRDDPTPARPEAGRTLAQTVATALTGRGDDDLWDRWVEAQAPGSPPEAVRRAALAAGWTMRQD